MLTRSQVDGLASERPRILKTAEALTPQHAAAEGGMDAEEAEEARRRREHVQDEVDPIPADAPEVAHADLGKRLAPDTTTGYPPMVPMVSAEEFRCGPVTGGYGGGYEPPARLAPVPSATPSPGMFSRPLITDGQSRPCAPEAGPC